MKKPSKKNLKKACDTLWSLIIRFKGKCEICGAQANQPHHVIGRINYVLRWDIRNGCLLCFHCHVYSRQAVHEDPQRFMIWFKEHRPDDYEYLLTKKNDVKTFNILDYQEIYRDLKVEYDKITT